MDDENENEDVQRRQRTVNKLSAESRASLGGGITSLYAMILVAIYLASSFTELVTFPANHKLTETHGFFLYLYLVSDLFLVYVIVHVAVGRRNGSTKIVENHKSHGSLPVRVGAVIFGMGTVAYFTLEFVALVEFSSHPDCFSAVEAANVVAAIALVVLQTYLIFVFPRMNLRISPFIDRLGTMHVFCTNLIIWIRTLIKESLMEIDETEEEAHKHEHDEDVHTKSEYFPGHDHGECSILEGRIKALRNISEFCKDHRTEFIGEEVLQKSSPFLFPFVIEYALIGASVVFVMWSHVGRSSSCGVASSDEIDVDIPSTFEIHTPSPKRFLASRDWSHSLNGLSCGLIVLLLAVLNLCLFFGLDGSETNEDEAELFSKATNIVVNSLGIIGLLLGLYQIQSLNWRRDSERAGDERDADALDLSLLRFTAFFAYLYLSFTVITGLLGNHENSAVHVSNGVIEAVQITMQIVFIADLKKKVLGVDEGDAKPGRQVTVFLSVLNLAQWLVFTFEMQKVRASVIEAEFYGFVPWALIQRLTLPMTIFFRFHSSVVTMELWKEAYVIEVPET